MNILCVHAHPDDFEFVTAGLFMEWKRRLGDPLRSRIIVCTDGGSGHHFRTTDEVARIRLQEQRESAKIGAYLFDPLTLPGGKPTPGGALEVTREFLAALWKAIRDFEPDYLVCPPLPGDPLAGIHMDHVATADAIRKVAYLINVPHAFRAEYPRDETKSESKRTPVILNAHDGYMHGSNCFDLVVDVEESFEKIAAMSFCHQCQIMEWLPWVGRHDFSPPSSKAEWAKMLRARFQKRNRELGLPTKRAYEVFTVTAWGVVPSFDQLMADIPNIVPKLSNLKALKAKLKRWRG